MSLRWIMLVGALPLLVACGARDADLKVWMDQQRQQTKSSVKPVEVPKNFVPQPYVEATTVEPFSMQKLSVALKSEARQPNSLVSGEINRRKQALEAYPLDSMSMVGLLTRQGRPHALIKVDKLLYPVKLGDYVGQNFGKVTKITETEVTMREIVQDTIGEWIERVSTLQLQEKAR